MLVKSKRTFYGKVVHRLKTFECENVQTLWNISNYIGFDVKWKNVIFGFYSVQNKTTFLYNLLLSFVALKIYKYNMYCKLEKNVESYEGILFHLKSCFKLQDYSDILSFSENKTYSSFFKKLNTKLVVTVYDIFCTSYILYIYYVFC